MSSSPLLFSSLPLRVGVRGSARAALRARTLSPNTIVSPLCFLVVLVSPSLLFSSLPAFLPPLSLSIIGMAVGDSPRVRVLCWHDSNRESVSFVLVFLVVACSSFSSSSVAATTVAFCAEDSPVVRVITSA